MKKLIAVAIIAVLALASCAKSEVPSGMQKAYAQGAPYKLYVPSGWTVDSSTVTATATSRDANPLTVTVTLTEAVGSPNAYLTSYLDRFAEVYTGFAAEPIENITLDGHTAAKLTFTGSLTTGDVTGDYKFAEIVALGDGLFHIITFSSVASAFDGFAETITEITDNYIFAEASEAENREAHDAPEGMKYASNDVVDYDLYVPEDWVLDLSTGVCSAYTNGGKTSISLTAWDISYMVNAVEDWREAYRSEMKMISKDFTETDESEVVLGGVTGKRYEGTYTVDMTEYRFVQVAVARKYMIYVLTYTTVSADVTAELERIVETFEFR